MIRQSPVLAGGPLEQCQKAWYAPGSINMRFRNSAENDQLLVRSAIRYCTPKAATCLASQGYMTWIVGTGGQQLRCQLEHIQLSHDAPLPYEITLCY